MCSNKQLQAFTLELLAFFYSCRNFAEDERHEIVAATTNQLEKVYAAISGSRLSQPGYDGRRQPHMMAVLCLQAQPVPLPPEQQGSPRSGWSERTVHSCDEE